MAEQLITLTALPKLTGKNRPKTNLCACGCGELTGSKFVPGHDSRMRGLAIRIGRNLLPNLADLKREYPGQIAAATAFLKAHPEIAEVGHGSVVRNMAEGLPQAVAGRGRGHDRKLNKRSRREAAKQDQHAAA